MSHRSRVRAPQGVCASILTLCPSFSRSAKTEKKNIMGIKIKESDREREWERESERETHTDRERERESERERWKERCVGGRARKHEYAMVQKHAVAAIAQLAARRSHNPKVVSSILTRRMLFVAKSPHVFYNFWTSLNFLFSNVFGSVSFFQFIV